VHTDPIPALKQEVAAKLVEWTSGCSLTFAAAFLGTDRFRMRDLRAGRLERFSLEKLIRLAANHHYDARIEFSKRRMEPRAVKGA
jgi:hypothetical protein